MILVYNVVTICCAVLMLVRFYPAILEALLDVLFTGIQWREEQQAYATQSKVHKLIERAERRIEQLREERAALQWFHVALVVLPIEELNS
jgi:hypothetical protein